MVCSCPYCGSSNFDEVDLLTKHCNRCNQLFSGDMNEIQKGIHG